MKWVEAHRKLHPLNGTSLCGATLCGITMKPLAQKRQRLPKNSRHIAYALPDSGRHAATLCAAARASRLHETSTPRSVCALQLPSSAALVEGLAARPLCMLPLARRGRPRRAIRGGGGGPPHLARAQPRRTRRRAPAGPPRQPPPQPRARAPWGGELGRTYETACCPSSRDGGGPRRKAAPQGCTVCRLRLRRRRRACA